MKSILTEILAAGGLLVVAGLLVAACTTLAPLEFPPDGGGCQSDEACKDNRICVEGACVFSGTYLDGGSEDGGPTDSGPIDGGKPDGGGGGPAPGELGGACELASECFDPGAVCIQDLPEGYCAIPGCRSCPAEGVCVLTEEGEPICIDGCASDSDCREGYQCNDTFGEFACVPSQGGGDTPVGGECSTAADCSGIPSFCIADWPGGYCVHGDCDACPAGSACVRDQDFAACMDTCASDADCREDYVCLNFRREQFCFFAEP